MFADRVKCQAPSGLLYPPAYFFCGLVRNLNATA